MQISFSKFMRLLLSFIILSTISAYPHAADRILLVAGGQTDAVGVPALEAALKEPFGTAFDQHQQLWIVEMASGNRLLTIDDRGMLRHIAGQAKSGFAGDGQPLQEAVFNGPHNLAIRPDGRILIADTWNGRIRQVDVKAGLVESIPGFDVPIEKAKGAGAYCITLDFTGTFLYVADLRFIRRIELATGKTEIVAGNGEKGIPNDGAIALKAPLSDPRAVAVDRIGNVYILERGGNALRVVNREGVIRTVVNASGKKGTARSASETNANDLAVSEPAIDAKMNGPKHLCIDAMNRVIIADAENHLIRRYDPTDGSLQRIAGTGKSGSQGVGGDPLQCQLARPHGVTVHPISGELYITDSYNNRILRISSVDHK
jgi:DNA-binding beta-propeller fold protein YncE